LLRRVVWKKFTDISIIALMMEAATTSDTSVNFFPEDSHLY
jgi:hypothetical protein